ncbi:alpha/beta fold hydrolase [Ottowia thiooxydans]|uniref:Pimeloyl-ACP methyl ester carboxylesterase n=1 Tax=Ottowia thiooxydans TaxID=219182 RepID=A0ABV2Q2F6_9BURK
MKLSDVAGIACHNKGHVDRTEGRVSNRGLFHIRGRLNVRASVLASVVLACGLSACGGDDSDPLQKYREQTVEWTACDPSILGVSNAAIDELWATVGDRLKCGYVKAPLDWSNTERGDVVMAVMRLAAGTPEKKHGSLVFNPGGPGADGLGLATSLLTAFSNSNPENPQGALQLRLLNEYDMIGFSPRGTGASTRFQCATNELERTLVTNAVEWDTPENIANSNYNGRKIAEACLKNPIAPYINTDATVRDVDLLRGLLGDEKLNYLGYSYGTWLGAWYASLFPEKVGRMVLDSSLDFSATLEQGVFLGQPPARQRLLDDVLAPYAVRHADYFQLGNTEAEVRGIMPSLSPRVQQVLATPLSGLGYIRTNADRYLDTIFAARSLDVLLGLAPDPADMEAVDEALDQHVFDSSNPQRNTALRETADSLLKQYAGTWVSPSPTSISMSSSASVLVAVHCNDTPATTDLTVWENLLRGLAPRFPMFFSSLLEVHACSFWGGPKVSKPAITPMKDLNVLLVQSQYDSATGTEGANALFQQLPKAHRVFVNNDFQHGVYPYTDSCVDPLVTGYLLGDSLTQREKICAGHPLKQDAPTPEGKAKAANSPEVPASQPPVYKDPERARELIEEFKRGLIPPQFKP